MKERYAVEVFKPGTHTTMHGEAITFAEKDLLATATAYDPSLFEAPFVVGHPSVDAPAYGWVKGLSVVGGKLLAEGHQVEPQFAEMVKDGRYKKVSARFYRPGSPDNPVPGSWYLRHVGFLGAVAPAVKGLKSAAFAAGEEGTVTVEFGEVEGWDLHNVASIFRRLREMFIEKFGSAEADQVLPNWQIDDLEAASRRKTADEASALPEFTETQKEEVMALSPEELKQKEKDLVAKEANFSEREQQISAREDSIKQQAVESRRAEAVAFCEGLVKEGRLLPADQGRMVSFMAGLSADTSVEFGEGDGKKSEPQLTVFKNIAQRLSKVVEFGEAAGTEHGEAEARNGNQDAAFAEDLTSRV